MYNLENIKKQLTTNEISFLVNIDRRINIDKNDKYYYYQISGINLASITNFILNIRNHDIVLVHPFISIKCRHNDPYLTLSRQFLLSNNSNSNLISEYLSYQLEEAGNDFKFDHDELDYKLIIKYKRVYLDDKFA